MPHAPTSLTWDPDTPFRFVGGEASLDYVNTVTWTDAGLVNDRLTDYARLTEWAVGAGLLARPHALRLRRAAVAHPARARAAYEASRELRDVLQRLFAAVAADAPLDEPLRRVDPWLAAAYARARLSPASGADRRAGRVLRWAWPDEEERLDGLLSPVMRNAADLLTSGEAARIRVCDGEDCGWVYVDRSRNGRRRWCEMEVCGTRAKSRRRAARQHAPT